LLLISVVILAQVSFVVAYVVRFVLPPIMNWPREFGAPYHELVWSFFPCWT